MGSLLRLHREWRFSGDDAFLRECWPAAVRSMDFALREWDTDKDGVLDARMHNTYDIFFDGAEPLGKIYFLAALKAMADGPAPRRGRCGQALRGSVGAQQRRHRQWNR
jgi:non-lysosomal glucosylceramidase